MLKSLRFISAGVKPCAAFTRPSVRSRMALSHVAVRAQAAAPVSTEAPASQNFGVFKLSYDVKNE